MTSAISRTNTINKASKGGYATFEKRVTKAKAHNMKAKAEAKARKAEASKPKEDVKAAPKRLTTDGIRNSMAFVPLEQKMARALNPKAPREHPAPSKLTGKRRVVEIRISKEALNDIRAEARNEWEYQSRLREIAGYLPNENVIVQPVATIGMVAKIRSE